MRFLLLLSLLVRYGSGSIPIGRIGTPVLITTHPARFDITNLSETECLELAMNDYLTVRTLGGLTIERDGTPVTNFDQNKVPGLLVYLACTGRSHPREVLAKMLYEKRPESQSLARLRPVLTGLRDTVAPFVDISRKHVSMNSASNWWLDVAEFENRIDAAGHDVIALEAALDLYKGDFLAGFHVESDSFEDWARRQREWLRQCALETMDQLIDCHMTQRDFTTGIARAYALLELDSIREKSYDWLMRLHALSGNRTQAMVQYEVLIENLHAQDLTPSSAIQALYEQIRRGTFPPTQLAATLGLPPEEPTHTSSSRSALLIKEIHGVPSRVEHLIGREDLLVEIHSLLDQNQRVLLQGFSGIGKTALAAEVAAQRIAAQQGPILWLVAGKESTPTLLEALARPFGASQTIAATQDDSRFQIIRNLLGEHDVRLVILDNVWDGRILKQIIRAIPPTTSLLLTSRHRLPVGKILTVGKLDLTHALALLGHHAFQTYQHDDGGARALCELVGCHPFALEIAGKTLHVDEMTPDELIDYIGEVPHLMVTPGWFADEGRESVKDLLDASVDALDAVTCDVFLAFGALFVPSATPALIGLCMDRDPAAIEEALGILHRRGLAERLRLPEGNVTYYAVHDLAYCYARANARLSSQSVIEACRNYVQHTHELNSLDAEIPNLLGAAQNARQTDQGSLLVDMMRCLVVETEYFKARGYNLQTLDLIEAAARQARDENQLETAHFLFGKYGDALAQNFNQLEPAIEAYRHALMLARTINNANREVTFLTLIGTTRFRQGADDADTYYDQAYTIASRHNDIQALTYILSHRSFYEGNKQPPNYENSWRASDEAARVAEQYDMHDVWWAALINRASAERELGRLDDALASDREAYAIARNCDNRMWIATALSSMGKDFHELGDRMQAQQYLSEALGFWRECCATAWVENQIAYMQAHDYVIEFDSEDE